MAKTNGYNQYICDRCATLEYATDENPKIKQWKEVERFTADGTTGKYLLCDKCIKKYRAVARKADEEFTHFMTERGDE